MALETQHFNRQWLIDELKSIAVSTVTIFAFDGVGELTKLYNGDFSRDVFVALAIILGRSLVKAILQMVFPKVFVKKANQA